MRVQGSVCMERLEGYPDIFQGAFTDDDHYVQQHLFARSCLMCVSWADGKETMTDISEPQSLNASQVASTSRSIQDLKAHKTRVIESSKPYGMVNYAFLRYLSLKSVFCSKIMLNQVNPPPRTIKLLQVAKNLLNQRAR